MMSYLKTSLSIVRRAMLISPCLSLALVLASITLEPAHGPASGWLLPAQAQFSAPPPSADRVVIPLVPTDVTNMRIFSPPPTGLGSMPKLDPGSAIKRLSDSDFPDLSQAKEDGVGLGLIVKPKSGCDMERPSPADVQLTSGTVFVSVRKPANLLIVTTPHGLVSLSSDAEAIISFRDGLLKVMNLSAFGERVKVRIHHAAVSATINGKTYSEDSSEASSEGIVIAVKYGHELVAGDRKLTEGDIRPVDDVARRRMVMFENDHRAVSEFSLSSALRDSDLFSDLGREPSKSGETAESQQRERHVLKDLAKMAAVLDYVYGESGYVTRGKNKKFAEK